MEPANSRRHLPAIAGIFLAMCTVAGFIAFLVAISIAAALLAVVALISAGILLHLLPPRIIRTMEALDRHIDSRRRLYLGLAVTALCLSLTFLVGLVIVHGEKKSDCTPTLSGVPALAPIPAYDIGIIVPRCARKGGTQYWLVLELAQSASEQKTEYILKHEVPDNSEHDSYPFSGENKSVGQTRRFYLSRLTPSQVAAFRRSGYPAGPNARVGEAAGAIVQGARQSKIATSVTNS